jgi:outer membrane protein assembly factor BamB
MLKPTALVVCAALLSTVAMPARADVKGWLSWRGPYQTGVSPEKGLPDRWKPGGANHLWTMDISGGGTPVLAGNHLYGLGYRGTGPDLVEVLFCADAATGRKIWEHTFSDYLSDITYDRYAIGSPSIDPETGNVYCLTSAGVFSCFSAAGKLLWQHSTMESLGRLTFTNGRTGAPTVDRDLVIMRGITSNWGAEGAAQDRMYAFDKKTGALVWSSSPGAPPKDPSFARPWITWRNGKRVMYTGSGDGAVIGVNARTGETLWRFPVSAGGMNSSTVMYKNTIIAIHADENLDSSDSGRMVAVKVDTTPTPSTDNTPAVMPPSAEAWRNELGAVSSSPVLVGNRIYQVNKTGQLCCVDADTGRILWKHRLGPDQLHASPTYADGKLYIPLQNGSFFIVRPSETGCEELEKVQLAGRCIGAPAVWNGRVYVFSTEKLYCFGSAKGGTPYEWPKDPSPKPGRTVALQILPSEVLLRPGQKASFTVRGIDANGLPTETFKSSQLKWARYIPPTARVKSEMNGDFNPQGELVAEPKQAASAGAFMATMGDLKGTIRGRVLPALPYKENFEEFVPTETMMGETEKFAYPPLAWIGARFKFDIRELDGNKVLAKTLDNIFFQRATVFLGHPDDSNYTVETDVMADGNRRTMPSVGVVNQRYYIILSGNAQEIEVNSNQERIKVTAPFKWSPKTWYHLKTRVDIASDGSGTVRAKAWKKGDPEPAAWNLEVPHKNAHKHGAPGLFGFSPQSLFKCYIDNVVITPNR